MVDLALEDFNRAFIDSEVLKVSMKTMGGGNIYLRALGRADITRFQRIGEELHARMALNLFSAPALKERVKDTDLADAEDYLVYKAMCDKDGESVFDNLDHYKKWSINVTNPQIEEILWHINDRMIVFYDPEEVESDNEKKLE